MARRLVVDGRLVVTAGAAVLESVPVWIAESAISLNLWRFEDESDGTRLAIEPIDDASRGALGFPSEGAALRLKVKVSSQSEKIIRFHAEYPWMSHGSIPLPAVSRKFLLRGIIAIETPIGTRTRLQATGLRRLDAKAEAQSGLEPDLEPLNASTDDPSSYKNANHALFEYNKAGCRLELATEPLAAASLPGVIREALLTTLVDPKGTTVNRLRLVVHPGEARSLELGIPTNMSVVRIRRDGTDVAPIAPRPSLSIPFPMPGSGTGSYTIIVDYTRAYAVISDGAPLQPDLPELTLPCLSFVWELVAPPGWRAADAGPGWIANDRENLFDWPYASLGLWNPPWSFLSGRIRASDAETYRNLDDMLVDSPSDELTFAEWFSRWDSGPRPIVIDRLSLSSAGFGPKSLCVPSRHSGERRNVSLATLQQHGLAIIRFQEALLITTITQRQRFEQRDCWAEPLAEALVWGSDRTDRFQTLPRWRGEPLTKAHGDRGRGLDRANQASARVDELEVRAGHTGRDRMGTSI